MNPLELSSEEIAELKKKLKACVYCCSGNLGIRYFWREETSNSWGSKFTAYWHVACHFCDSKGPKSSHAEGAVNKWNHRIT